MTRPKRGNFWNPGGGPTGRFVRTVTTRARNQSPHWKPKGQPKAVSAKASTFVGLPPAIHGHRRDSSGTFPRYVFQLAVIDPVTRKNLGAALGGMREPGSGGEYRRAPDLQAAPEAMEGHQTVNHSRGEYLRLNPDGPKVSTNTAEPFLSLLK